MDSDGERTPDAVLVPGAHRTIRMLDAGEGPYPGALVSQRESMAVQTDADAISGWVGWAHAGHEHVAGPLDLVRRPDGHDVLLPWCTERISAFLGRRSATQVPLSAGEVSTLVSSMLRGIAELGSAVPAERTGEWWLTDGGRPVFVIGAGTDARASAARLVARLQRDVTDRASARVLGAIAEGLDDVERPQLPPRLLDGWERELLAIAAPRPLRRDLHGPERARDIEMVSRMPPLPPETGRGVRRGPSEVATASRGENRWLIGANERLAAVRAGLTARWARHGREHRPALTPGPRTRTHEKAREGADDAPAPTRRVRRLVVAGAVAAVVLAGGLLWPSEEKVEGTTSDAVDAPTPASSPVETSEVAPGPPSSSTTPSARGPATGAAEDPDPMVAVEALWERIGVCAQSGDELCESAVAGGASGVLDAIGDAAEAAPLFALVDEYGDVAVLKVSSADAEADGAAVDGAAERMLVLVRVAERWLVRDVYDVADQPG